MLDDATGYADLTARLNNMRTCQWIHPVGSVITALIDAGQQLDWLHEQDAVT